MKWAFIVFLLFFGTASAYEIEWEIREGFTFNAIGDGGKPKKFLFVWGEIHADEPVELLAVHRETETGVEGSSLVGVFRGIPESTEEGWTTPFDLQIDWLEDLDLEIFLSVYTPDQTLLHTFDSIHLVIENDEYEVVAGKAPMNRETWGKPLIYERVPKVPE